MDNNKLHELKEVLLGLEGPVAIAFSGGVDSTLLLAALLKYRSDVVAFTVRSAFSPAWELAEAGGVARTLGAKHEWLDVDVFDHPIVVQNPADRCYHCKRALFTRMLEAAQALGCRTLVDGTNVDDLGDYRPGMKALGELGVRSPLREANWSKADVRALSRDLGLSTAAKPAYACLASRIPYGTPLTPEALRQVERAEDFFRARGFEVVRVRSHGDVARVEVSPSDIPRVAAMAEEVAAAMREAGFRYAALDLTGYRTGSLNEVLGDQGGGAKHGS